MPDISVVIYFVGLTVFTNQIDTDLGVKAILPRVIYKSPISTERHQHTSLRPQYQMAQIGGRVSRDALAAPLFDVKHVEDHEAVLVFPTSSYHPSSTWGTPGVILNANQTKSQWSYVRLDSDLVRFVSNSPAMNDMTGVAKLPKLRTELCGTKMQTLRNDYQPPYTGAAGVFDITRGTLQSCKSAIPNTNSAFRLDTRLLLTAPSAPFFVVSASTSKIRKELRLKPSNGTVELLVANVPKRYLQGSMGGVDPAALNGMSHDQAIFSMGAGSGTCKSLAEWLQDNDTSLMNVPDCAWSSLPAWKTASGSADSAAPEGIMMSSFECSNTQWP